jgi:hypothetical protein
MKKFFVLIFIVFSVSVFFADPPKNVDLSYDLNSKVLTVDVKHPVNASDIKVHYIKLLNVSVNGKSINKIVLKGPQQSVAGIIETFPIELKSGDKVSVMAECSLMGQKTGKLTIK